MEREDPKPNDDSREIGDRLAKERHLDSIRERGHQSAQRLLIFERFEGRSLPGAVEIRDEQRLSRDERFALNRSRLLELEPKKADLLRMRAENRALARIQGLHPYVWESLKTNGRLYVLSQAEHVLARFQYRTPCRIRAVEMPPGTRGIFVPQNNLILIDERFVDSEKGRVLADGLFARETLWHESDHRLQKEAIKNPNAYRELGLSEIAAMKGRVPNSLLDYEGYKNHPREVRSILVTQQREAYLHEVYFPGCSRELDEYYGETQKRV